MAKNRGETNKRALLVLADGFEDIEAAAPFDILKRAGVAVKTAGLESQEVKSARGLKITTDTTLDAIEEEEFDCIVLPGGSGGAEKLSKSVKLKTLIQKMSKNGKIIAAICASPAWVLAPAGILDGKNATCYPGAEKSFSAKTNYINKEVVVDENIITSQGPATALLFGIKIVEMLRGSNIADTIKKNLLIK